MDNHYQLSKSCGTCGNKRVYNHSSSLVIPSKICVGKNSAKDHQTKREKLIARSKLYQENTKYVTKSQTQQTEELNIKVEQLTHAMKKLFFKN